MTQDLLMYMGPQTPLADPTQPPYFDSVLTNAAYANKGDLTNTYNRVVGTKGGVGKTRAILMAKVIVRGAVLGVGTAIQFDVQHRLPGTALSAAAAASGSATTLTVVDSSVFTVGQLVDLGAGGNFEQRNIVTIPSATTVTVAALTYAHASGEGVKPPGQSETGEGGGWQLLSSGANFKRYALQNGDFGFELPVQTNYDQVRIFVTLTGAPTVVSWEAWLGQTRP